MFFSVASQEEQWNDVKNPKTQKPKNPLNQFSKTIIPSFHYSICERSELSSV